MKLQLPDGNEEYRTLCGSLLSVLTYLLVGLYGLYKLFTLFSYEDYKVQERQQVNYFDALDAFGSEDSFAFAIGVISYDGSGEPIEDPSIGQVNFFVKSWGENAPLGQDGLF